MSLIIPYSFASRTNDIALSELDDNFNYISGQIDQTNSDLTTLTGTVNSLSQAISTNTVTLGSWTITQASNSLYFKYNGVNKMKLDSNGNIIAVGDITAYGSIT